MHASCTHKNLHELLHVHELELHKGHMYSDKRENVFFHHTQFTYIPQLVMYMYKNF